MTGLEAGKSNYSNYRWMPDSSIAWATNLIRFMRLGVGDSILDVGASRGFYVRALRMLGMDAYGYDISEWAVANCDTAVKQFMSNHLNGAHYDFVFSKDCFEHVPLNELRSLVKYLLSKTDKMFVIVPLAEKTDGKYVHEKEENDPTHVNRWTLHDWLAFFMDCSPSFIVNGSYRYPGLKPGCYEVEFGYGFFFLTKT